MEIIIKLDDKKYGIKVESNSFIPIAYKTVLKKDSVNFGTYNPCELGHFTKLSGASLRIVREHIILSDDVVTFQEFSRRCEAIMNDLKAQIDLIPV